jgi:hypothetical protein
MAMFLVGGGRQVPDDVPVRGLLAASGEGTAAGEGRPHGRMLPGGGRGEQQRNCSSTAAHRVAVLNHS